MATFEISPRIKQNDEAIEYGQELADAIDCDIFVKLVDDKLGGLAIGLIYNGTEYAKIYPYGTKQYEFRSAPKSVIQVVKANLKEFKKLADLVLAEQE